MDAVMHDNYRKVVDQVVCSASWIFCLSPRQPIMLQKAGIARPSVTANHLEDMYAEAKDKNQEEHDALKMAAAMIFAGNSNHYMTQPHCLTNIFSAGFETVCVVPITLNRATDLLQDLACGDHLHCSYAASC